MSYKSWQSVLFQSNFLHLFWGNIYELSIRKKKRDRTKEKKKRNNKDRKNNDLFYFRTSTWFKRMTTHFAKVIDVFFWKCTVLSG